MKSAAFHGLTPFVSLHHQPNFSAPTSPRSLRPAAFIRNARPQACLPSNNDDDKSESQSRQTHAPKSAASQWSVSKVNKRMIAEAEATFDELDTMAEQWIGTNVARWEWYEGVKARRHKLMLDSKKTDKEMEDSYERLQKTFMEFDAVFGTKLLDNDTRISPTGWGLVVFTMLLYVFLGYAAVEILVKFITEIFPSTWY